MNCPKCRSATNQMTIEGVELDFCPTCKGMWFDKDEVAFLEELPDDVPDISEVEKDARKTDYDCPRCGIKLEEMKFMKVQDLLIDLCPQCKGIWLDEGELSKLEGIAAHIGDAKSKIIRACKQLQEKGYQVVGVKAKR
jgi:Zn-finger nucleic acid-binding protein